MKQANTTNDTIHSPKACTIHNTMDHTKDHTNLNKHTNMDCHTNKVHTTHNTKDRTNKNHQTGSYGGYTHSRPRDYNFHHTHLPPLHMQLSATNQMG